MAYIICDFDGVLCDTYDYEVKFAESDQISKELMKQNNIRSTKDFIERCCIDYEFGQGDDKEADERYQAFIENKPIKLFDEFVKNFFSIKNIKISIVSGNNSNYIKKSLKKYLSKIDYILGIKEGLSKVYKINTICKNIGIEAHKDVIYITDTIADYIELKDNVKNIYVCTWGFQKYEVIHQYVDKEHILSHYKDFFQISNKLSNEK